LEAFVALEMNGWKGQQATAFGSKVGDLAFLEEVAHSAAQCEELMLLGLWLDDKPLALKLNFLCGDGGYTFKIAYDETYSKYSPGVLLELENIRQAHSETNLTWLDSLALRNHPMVNRIWLDRATIVTQLVAPGRTVGKLVLGLLPLLGTAKNMLRSEA
jgi:CelD/BcsL family acetyltransferase involved in cellulose biosynthesis